MVAAWALNGLLILYQELGVYVWTVMELGSFVEREIC